MAEPPGAAAPPSISPRLVLLLAVACGAAVANLYYAQPLLHTIARSLHTGSGTAGLIVTLSQIGYAVGLVALVPLGDLFSRRRLVPLVLSVTAAALVASAVMPAVGGLIALALVIGLGSVAAQMLVPMAAQLAGDHERGRVVGRVMSGLLLGILLARTLSGLVAGAAGWRVVYWLGAGLAVLLAAVLARALPAETRERSLTYPQLLRSTAELFAREPLLRRRALFGALAFAAFSVFWTTVAFLLSGSPFHYGDSVIGLFGLVGAAGALCASLAGRMADRGWTAVATTGFAAAMALSYVILGAGRTSVGWLIVGIVVLDVGVQGVHITNQSIVYAVAPEARSRVTSVYMVCYFAGGALGSAVAAALYGAHGWTGVCWLGGALGAAATVLALYDAARPARRRPGSRPAKGETPAEGIGSPR